MSSDGRLLGWSPTRTKEKNTSQAKSQADRKAGQVQVHVFRLRSQTTMLHAFVSALQRWRNLAAVQVIAARSDPGAEAADVPESMRRAGISPQPKTRPFSFLRIGAPRELFLPSCRPIRRPLHTWRAKSRRVATRGSAHLCELSAHIFRRCEERCRLGPPDARCGLAGSSCGRPPVGRDLALLWQRSNVGQEGGFTYQSEGKCVFV